MRVTRADLLTPANALTFAGLTLTIIGSASLDKPLGIGLVVIGRLLDVIDGPVARRTHASQFGALLDASADKLAIVFLVAAALILRQAPYVFLVYVLVQNAVNAALGLYAIAQRKPLLPSLNGKHTMFLQVTSIILFALSLQVSNSYFLQINIGLLVFFLAVITSFTSAVLGILASGQYFKEAMLRKP